MDIADRFAKETLNNIHSLEQLFVFIKAETRYGGPRAFANFAIDLCKILYSSLSFALIRSHTKTQDGLIKLCNRYQNKLNEIHRTFTSLLAGSYMTYCYPNDLIPTIERLISKFLPCEKYKLILQAWQEETYQVKLMEASIDKQIVSLKPFYPKSFLPQEPHPDWFIFLSFPKVYGNDLLLHTNMLSHEVLHLFDYFKKISEEIKGNLPSINLKLIQPIVESILEMPVINKELIPKRRDIPGREQLFTTPLTYRDFYTETQLSTFFTNECGVIIEKWLAEIVADILSTRLYGPAFPLAFARVSLALSIMDNHSDEHPSSRLRLKLMFKELDSLGYPGNKNKKTQLFINNFNKLKTFINTGVPSKGFALHDAVAKHLLKPANKKIITEAVRKYTSDKEYPAAKFHQEVWGLITLLENDIPPSEIISSGESSNLPSILNAGWIFYYNFRDYLKYHQFVDVEKADFESVININKLISKAIENIEFCQIWQEHKSKTGVKSPNKRNFNNLVKNDKNVLSDSELYKRLIHKEYPKKLTITPLIDIEIKGGGIDLRLGTKFIVTKRTQYPLIDPLEITQSDPLEFLDRIAIPFNSHIILHPGQLILAMTLEYICIPNDLAGFISTRSTFGRMGLITATASYVHPGYKGCPTLELYNYGETPIVLYPAMRIAQITLHSHLADIEDFASKYSISTEPEYPKIWDDWDIQILKSISGARLYLQRSLNKRLKNN